MTPERPALERRILASLDATPPRIPVLLGGCGSGRTSLLLRLASLLGDGAAQYIDAERVASTPEGFCTAVLANSPYIDPTQPPPHATLTSARAAFDSTLSFFRSAHGPGDQTATFLIDEVLELRTFESFPGLRSVLRELIDSMAQSPNRFVLTSRYTSRVYRRLRDAPPQFELIHVAPLAPPEVAAALASLHVGGNDTDRSDLARTIHALTDGRPAYVRALARALADTRERGPGDPVSALASELAVGAPLSMLCRFCYELRLHRARGYGALKAILCVLAEEEPLTLTEIAQRLRRTPGSTKDYLSWLEDVDLVAMRQKRYSYTDPLLRLWVRLHSRSVPPLEADLARDVQDYALTRLPYVEPVMALADAAPHPAGADADKTWSMIEID